MKALIAALMAVALLVALGGCAGSGSASQASDDTATSGRPETDSTGERITIDGDEALLWGDGSAGIVLAHGAAFDAASWEDQASQVAEQGYSVIAVESIDPGAIAAAVTYLREEADAAGVALIGGSAGANAILDLVSGDDEVDPSQLILLAPTSVVDGLGTEPKLFIASEGDPVAHVSEELAKTANGDDNEVLIVSGSAHAQNMFDTDQGEQVTAAILERLGPAAG